MVKKKLDKHALKEDPIIEFFLRGYEYIKTHQNVVFIGLIALILIVAGTFWVRNSREEARINAANRFSEATLFFYRGDFKSAGQIFEIVRENYGGTREGAYASYYLGKVANATGDYTGAINHFRNYLEKSKKYPFFREAARRSIATSLENNRDFDRAGDIYAELAGEEQDDDEKARYLERAAECYELAGMDSKAVEILKELLPLRDGLAEKEIKVRIDILSR